MKKKVIPLSQHLLIQKMFTQKKAIQQIIVD